MSKRPFDMHLDADAFLPATESEKEYMVAVMPSFSSSAFTTST